MAKFEDLIPHILYRECRLPERFLCLPLDLMFEQAKIGGFANDPADSGGATMCGVTIATYRSIKPGAKIADLKNITLDEWISIFKKRYWDKCRADEIEDQSVANMIVDWTWASGNNGIIRTQKILGVKSDGIVGSKTINAINATNGRALFDKLKADRHLYHEQIINRSVEAFEHRLGRPATLAEKTKYTKYRFSKGWRNRVNGIGYGSFSFT